MDRERFDALAKLLATTGSRRAALGALLGAGLLGHDPGTAAKPGNSKSHDRQRRRKRRHKGNGGHDAGQPQDPCCGTRHCAAPEHGSTRSQCDFQGRSFAGQDLNGSIFRGIDGRRANFSNTANRGSVFAEACLFLANFRGARLAGSTWGGACLFAANFIGADLGDDADALDGAVLCGTVMPDGTRYVSVCGHLPRCCQPAQGGPGPCTSIADCPNELCFITQSCTDGVCSYTQRGDGPDPSGQCATICCGGGCCAAGTTTCDRVELCCFPTCQGRTCGHDGCGGTCGTCAAGTVCDNSTGVCRCTAQTCSSGCCTDASTCAPSCPAGKTCRGGVCVCATAQGCAGGQECVDGECLCTERSCPNGCCDDGPGTPSSCLANDAETCGLGGQICQSCFASDDQVCRDGRCRCTGPKGCGSDQECVDGVCLCTSQSCPFGCCTNGPGRPGGCLPGDGPRACGRNGDRCAKCSNFQECRQGRCQRQQQ